MPGVIPSVFAPTTSHGPFGAPPVTDPRTISSTDMGRARIRFVNQLESGTSSSVLTFSARMFAVSAGFMNVFSRKSYGSLKSCTATPLASCVSTSAAMGSSGKNFGVAPRLDTAPAANMSATNQRVNFIASAPGERQHGHRPPCSKGRTELRELPHPLMAAHCHVESEEDVLVGVESESNAVRRLEIAETDILPVPTHLARVEKQRHVEARERFPSVLGVHEQGILVAEAELAEAAQRVGAADGWHDVERHAVALLVVHVADAGAHGEHTPLVEDGEVVGRLGIEPVEIELPQRPIL